MYLGITFITLVLRENVYRWLLQTHYHRSSYRKYMRFEMSSFRFFFGWIQINQHRYHTHSRKIGEKQKEKKTKIKSVSQNVIHTCFKWKLPNPIEPIDKNKRKGGNLAGFPCRLHFVIHIYRGWMNRSRTTCNEREREREKFIFWWTIRGVILF